MPTVEIVPSGQMLDSIGERIRWVVEHHLRINQSELARRLKIHQPQVSRWINDPSRPPNEASIRAIAAVAGVSPAWLRYGVGAPTDDYEPPEEETPEQAVAQSEVEAEVERILDIVRLVDGKDDFTPEQRRGLKRDILNTYIDAFQEDGLDTRELYIMLGKVDRGEL